MSSLISKYAQKEQLLKQLQEELLKLEQNDELKKELEFKEQLEMLMKEYDKTSQEVIQIIAPERFFTETETKKTTRKPRKLKVYKNPNTGEVIKTRGGNQKTLKAWKEEYGDEVVESWLVTDDGDNVDINKAIEEASSPSADDKQEEKGEKEEPKQDEKAPETADKAGKEKEEPAKH